MLCLTFNQKRWLKKYPNSLGFRHGKVEGIVCDPIHATYDISCVLTNEFGYLSVNKPTTLKWHIAMALDASMDDNVIEVHEENVHIIFQWNKTIMTASLEFDIDMEKYGMRQVVYKYHNYGSLERFDYRLLEFCKTRDKEVLYKLMKNYCFMCCKWQYMVDLNYCPDCGMPLKKTWKEILGIE